MESDQPTIERIAPDGDLIFIIGPEKTEVQVDSNVMKAASPVFAAMLGPNFSEGQKLLARDEEPVSIELPEDNAKHFIIIAKAVHADVELRETPSLDEVLDIVRLADKYDFCKSLSETFDCWINELGKSEKYPDEVWPLLVAAYILGHSEAFAELSRRLLLQHEESFWNLAKTTPDFEPSFKLACQYNYLNPINKVLLII